MGRTEHLFFATPLFLLGLCMMLLLGRVPGALAGFVIAGLVICVMHPGSLRIAALTLLCCVGLVITMLAGATPEWIIRDLAHFLTAGDPLALLLSSGGSVDLRLGCGLLGGGLCTLVFDAFCGKTETRP